MNTDKRYILQIKEAIARILLFTETMNSADELKGHTLAADAVIMNFILIAENVHKLSAETKNAYPDIRWENFNVAEQKIGNIKLGIDYDYAWKTIKEDLQKLQDKL